MIKKNLIKGALFFVSAVVFSSQLFAENQKIKELINQKYYSELMEKGVVTLCRDDGSSDFQLLPKSDYSDKVNASKVVKEEKKYPFTYESLYCLNKNELLKKSNSSASTITIDDVSRVCRSVSKMEGMKYTNQKGKQLVLYKKCYRVSDEKSNEKLPDDISGSADGVVQYCLQDDETYGINHYRLNYYQSENQMLAQFTIADTMGLAMFKAIYPGKMVINILVTDCGDDLLLFMSTDIDSVKYPGIKDMISTSMTERMDAVYNWFTTQF